MPKNEASTIPGNGQNPIQYPQQIHEARQTREAEKRDPGVVRRTVDTAADAAPASDLTAVQRAKFTAARKKAYLAAHPQTKKGGDRRSKSQLATSKKAPSFIDDTATKTGRHRASIARDVARAEALGDDIDRVSGTSLDKGAELDALALLRS